MNILITGATGLIGGALVQHLRDDHALGALSRSPDSARERLPQLEQAWAWTPREEPAPADALRWAEAVIHLAGESVQGRWSDAKKERILESRREGTRNLVAGIAALPEAERPEALISASAIGYYGERGDDVLREEEPPGDDFLAEVCEAWEAEARGAESLGLRVARLRFGIVLTAEGGALGEMLTPAKLALNGPMGSGKQWWSWIHIHDLLGLITRATLVDWRGAYNATAPEPERQKAFAKVLGKVIGRPAFMPVPATMLKIVLGGFSAELLTSRRVVPSRAMEGGYVFAFPALREALEDLLG